MNSEIPNILIRLERMALLVGGHGDGQWVHIEPFMQEYRMPVIIPIVVTEDVIQIPEDPKFKYDIYYRERFLIGQQRYSIFRLNSISTQEAFEYLLKGYKGNISK